MILPHLFMEDLETLKSIRKTNSIPGPTEMDACWSLKRWKKKLKMAGVYLL
jgi:hypothetical protein